MNVTKATIQNAATVEELRDLLRLLQSNYPQTHWQRDLDWVEGLILDGVQLYEIRFFSLAIRHRLMLCLATNPTLYQYTITEQWAKLIIDDEVMDLICQKAEASGMSQGEIESFVEYFNCGAKVLE